MNISMRIIAFGSLAALASTGMQSFATTGKFPLTQQFHVIGEVQLSQRDGRSPFKARVEEFRIERRDIPITALMTPKIYYELGSLGAGAYKKAVSDRIAGIISSNKPGNHPKVTLTRKLIGNPAESLLQKAPSSIETKSQGLNVYIHPSDQAAGVEGSARVRFFDTKTGQEKTGLTSVLARKFCSVSPYTGKVEAGEKLCFGVQFDVMGASKKKPLEKIQGHVSEGKSVQMGYHMKFEEGMGFFLVPTRILGMQAFNVDGSSSQGRTLTEVELAQMQNRLFEDALDVVITANAS